LSTLYRSIVFRIERAGVDLLRPGFERSFRHFVASGAGPASTVPAPGAVFVFEALGQMAEKKIMAEEDRR